MIGADSNQPDNAMQGDDFLLVDDQKNNDIIDSGEVIAGNIGKFKCVQPGTLAGQLQKLQLVFKDEIVADLNSVSKCIAIEGVEISNEELEALKEAAMAKREAEGANEEIMNLGPSDMGKGGKAQAQVIAQPNAQDLAQELDRMTLGKNPSGMGGMGPA